MTSNKLSEENQTLIKSMWNELDERDRGMIVYDYKNSIGLILYGMIIAFRANLNDDETGEKPSLQIIHKFITDRLLY